MPSFAECAHKVRRRKPLINAQQDPHLCLSKSYLRHRCAPSPRKMENLKRPGAQVASRVYRLCTLSSPGREGFPAEALNSAKFVTNSPVLLNATLAGKSSGPPSTSR